MIPYDHPGKRAAKLREEVNKVSIGGTVYDDAIFSDLGDCPWLAGGMIGVSGLTHISCTARLCPV